MNPNSFLFLQNNFGSFFFTVCLICKKILFHVKSLDEKTKQKIEQKAIFQWYFLFSIQRACKKHFLICFMVFFGAQVVKVKRTNIPNFFFLQTFDKVICLPGFDSILFWRGLNFSISKDICFNPFTISNQNRDMPSQKLVNANGHSCVVNFSKTGANDTNAKITLFGCNQTQFFSR